MRAGFDLRVQQRWENFKEDVVVVVGGRGWRA